MGMNMNSGYHGWSMSKNAYYAYMGVEMPKSKWSKAAIIAAIQDELHGLISVDLEQFLVAVLSKFSKCDLFRKFFYCSSWHHTSKYCNPTDFYSLDDQELWEFVNALGLDGTTN